jgi:hypothetical protein
VNESEVVGNFTGNLVVVDSEKLGDIVVGNFAGKLVVVRLGDVVVGNFAGLLVVGTEKLGDIVVGNLAGNLVVLDSKKLGAVVVGNFAGLLVVVKLGDAVVGNFAGDLVVVESDAMLGNFAGNLVVVVVVGRVVEEPPDEAVVSGSWKDSAEGHIVGKCVASQLFLKIPNVKIVILGSSILNFKFNSMSREYSPK